MPAGGLTGERRLKEYGASFGQRVGCPLTSICREYKVSGVVDGDPQRGSQKADVR